MPCLLDSVVSIDKLRLKCALRNAIFYQLILKTELMVMSIPSDNFYTMLTMPIRTIKHLPQQCRVIKKTSMSDGRLLIKTYFGAKRVKQMRCFNPLLLASIMH